MTDLPQASRIGPTIADPSSCAKRTDMNPYHPTTDSTGPPTGRKKREVRFYLSCFFLFKMRPIGLTWLHTCPGRSSAPGSSFFGSLLLLTQPRFQSGPPAKNIEAPTRQSFVPSTRHIHSRVCSILSKDRRHVFR